MNDHSYYRMYTEMANIIKYHHISTSAVCFSEDSLFPIDGSAEEARNFCRNLDNDNVPWCYTSDKYRRWDYCDLQITQGSVCLCVCMCVFLSFCLSVETLTVIMLPGVIPVLIIDIVTTATFR